MANIVAQGQMTIVDLHDMPPISGRLTSNRPKFVVVSGDSKKYSPDWSKDNLIILAELYKAGQESDLISTNDPNVTSIKWFITKGTSAETPLTPTTGVVLGTSGSSRHQNKVTISTKDLITTQSPVMKIRAVVSYAYPGTRQEVPVSIEIDFSLVNNGATGQASYSAMLTNTSHVFPCGANGEVIPAETQTTAVVYEGGKSIPDGEIKLAVKNSAELPSGLTAEPLPGRTNAFKIKTTNGNLGGKSQGTIVFEATVKAGTPQEKKFELLFSWSKAQNGSNGSSSTSYWTYLNSPAIVKKWDGSKWKLEPSTIVANAMYQKGSGEPAQYNGRFKIQLYKGSSEIKENGSVVSPSDSSSLSMEPKTTDFTHAVITLYQAGGTSKKLDEEQVRVIEEPRKPVVIDVTATSDTIRNNTGSATLRVHVYRDGKEVSDSVTKKWVKGTGSIDSLPSLGTGTELKVLPNMVASSEIFKCQVTVDGTKYVDSIVIYDTSDPIQSTIQSSNGDTFKNGAGSTVLTCRTWRNGTVLDEDGKDYMYCWHKMDKSGVEDVNWAPVPVLEATDTNKSNPKVCKVLSGSGATYTLDNVYFVRKGYTIFFDGITTAYKVTAVDTSKKQITVSPTPSGIGAEKHIRVANYKQIRVDDRQVSEKATFLCELVQ